MKAAKISHTVVFEKPDSAQVRAALADLKPGFASSAGPNSTYGARIVTSEMPIRPIAAPGSGSSISATMTPANLAKKYQGCRARCPGGGMPAGPAGTAVGTPAAHGNACPPFSAVAFSAAGR